MTSTEIALLLNSDLEKVIRIGEIIGKKIPERDEFYRSKRLRENVYLY